MTTLFIRFAGDGSDVTAIECGLIAGLLVRGIIASVILTGTTLPAKFFGAVAAGFS